MLSKLANLIEICQIRWQIARKTFKLLIYNHLKKEDFMHFLRQGNKNTPIIFIHGFMGCSKDFEPIMDILHTQNECIAIDLPGHGKNYAHLPKRCLFKHLTNVIKGYITNLGTNKCHLVGYSMGGRLALQIASSYPNLIDKLVLISTNPGLVCKKEKQDRMQFDKHWANKLKTCSFDTFLTEWYSQTLFAPNKKSHFIQTKKQILRYALEDYLIRFSVAKQASFWEYLLHQKNEHIHVVLGSNDIKYIDLYKPYKDKLYIDEITNAYHSVHIEQPMYCAQAIQRHLGRPYNDTSKRTNSSVEIKW